MEGNDIEFAVIGLVTFMLARNGAQTIDRRHFGSWRQAPAWARDIFGSNRGTISPYHLSVQLAAVVWIVGGLLLWFGGNPPVAPWRQLIAWPMVISLVACVVACIVAFVGEQRRPK